MIGDHHVNGTASGADGALQAAVEHQKGEDASERQLATAKPWQVCGIGRSTWFKLARSCRTPLPVRLGTRRPVWVISELEEWLRAGAPDRGTWLRMKKR
jgi:predicted DNA-binding transcriptional regulator AlpA